MSIQLARSRGSLVPQGQLGLAIGFALFGIALYLAYRCGIALSRSTPAPLWFADSVLLAGLLATRRRFWPVLLATALPLRLLLVTHSPPAPLWFGLAAWPIDCAKAILAATLLQRALNDPFRLNSVRDFGWYCAVCVLLVPMVGASLGAWAMSAAFGQRYWVNWQQWFYGDSLTALIVTPIVFYWVFYRYRGEPWSASLARWAGIGALLGGLAVSTWLTFDPIEGPPGFTDMRFYVPVAFLLWTAIRYGMLGASGAMGVLTFVALAAAMSSRGPFAGESISAVATHLQQFLLVRAAPLYLVAVLVDQTHRAGAFLRESERRFRYLADTAPVLIWMSAADKLCFFFNKGWLDFTGRTLAQERGNGWLQSVHPEDVQRCMGTYVTHFDARQPFEMDYRMRRRDGEYRWILDKGVPRYTAGGEFLGYIGSAIDVTERRQQEAALRASEERYREVVESQTELVCRFLPDTTLTFVNEAYCRFFARSRQELLGQKMLPLIPEPARPLAQQSLHAAAQGGKPSGWECEMPATDGSGVSQRWVCHAIFDAAGTPQEFQAIGHDVTDRKRAEEADRKLVHAARLAAVGELTALVAHEINQPLCAILSNAEAAELLLQKPDPPLIELRQIMADICRDDLRANETIRAIRTLTQKRQPELVPLDANQIVGNVLRLAAGDALRRGVHIRRELAADLPPVLADGPSLEQVLLNLIVNGMDAMENTPRGERQLTIRTRPFDGVQVEIAVIDRGRGISSDEMPHLFDSFFTTKQDGIGLGLSIASSIVQAHSGRIWAENEAGGGAIFRFTVRQATSHQVAEGNASKRLRSGLETSRLH